MYVKNQRDLQTVTIDTLQKKFNEEIEKQEKTIELFNTCISVLKKFEGKPVTKRIDTALKKYAEENNLPYNVYVTYKYGREYIVFFTRNTSRENDREFYLPSTNFFTKHTPPYTEEEFRKDNTHCGGESTIANLANLKEFVSDFAAMANLAGKINSFNRFAIEMEGLYNKIPSRYLIAELIAKVD